MSSGNSEREDEGPRATGDSSAAAGKPTRKRRFIHYLPGFTIILGLSAIPLIMTYGGAPYNDMDGILQTMFLPFIAAFYILIMIRRLFPKISRVWLIIAALPAYGLSAGLISALAIYMPMAVQLRMAEEQLRPLSERVEKVRAVQGRLPDNLSEILAGIGEKDPDRLRHYGIHYWHDARDFVIIAIRGGRFTSPTCMYSTFSGQWKSKLMGEVIDYDRLTEGMPVKIEEWDHYPWPPYSYEGAGKWRYRKY